MRLPVAVLVGLMLAVGIAMLALAESVYMAIALTGDPMNFWEFLLILIGLAMAFGAAVASGTRVPWRR